MPRVAVTPPSPARDSAIGREAAAAQLVLARFDRLRRLAERHDVPDHVRSELRAEAGRALLEAAPVRASFAATALGVSKPTVYRWIAEGTLERVSTNPDRVTLASVVDARSERVQLPPEMRDLARRAGVPEPRLAHWLERAVVGPEDAEYIATHGSLLGRLHDALDDEPALTTAVLFGSVARGDDAPGSDVDLLVDTEPGAAAELTRRLNQALERQVDVVTLQSALEQPSLLSPVLQEGRALVDRAAVWCALLARQEQIRVLAAAEDAFIAAEGRAAIAAMKARHP